MCNGLSSIKFLYIEIFKKKKKNPLNHILKFNLILKKLK